jgi:hypothetical protein
MWMKDDISLKADSYDLLCRFYNSFLERSEDSTQQQKRRSNSTSYYYILDLRTEEFFWNMIRVPYYILIEIIYIYYKKDGMLHSDPLVSKRSLFLLKKTIDLSTKIRSIDQPDRWTR